MRRQTQHVPRPPSHTWCVGHMAITSNILSHRKVPFHNLPPPTWKNPYKTVLPKLTDVVSACTYIYNSI